MWYLIIYEHSAQLMGVWFVCDIFTFVLKCCLMLWVFMWGCWLRGCCNRLCYLTFESLSCIYSYVNPSTAAHFMTKNFYSPLILAIWCLYATVALLKMCRTVLLRVVKVLNYSRILQQIGFACKWLEKVLRRLTSFEWIVQCVGDALDCACYCLNRSYLVLR